MKDSAKLSQALKTFKPSEELSSDLFARFGDNKEFNIEMVTDFQTRIKAYQLLYKTYVEKEFARPHSSKMWYSVYDLHPTTVTFVVKEGDRVCGALTMVIDSEMGLPVDSVFSDEINELRSGSKVAEIISLGINSTKRGASIILEKLFNFSYIYSKGIFNVSDVVVTVNPRHALFYEKKLLFKRVGLEKEYDRVEKMPAVLLTLKVELVASIVESDYFLDNYKKNIYPSFVSIEDSKHLISFFKKNLVEMSSFELAYLIKERELLSATPSIIINALQKYIKHTQLRRGFFAEELNWAPVF